MSKYFVFLLFFFFNNCKNGNLNKIKSSKNGVYIEISKRDSVLDSGEKNNYGRLFVFEYKKVKYLIGKNINCLSFNGAIELSSTFFQKGDSLEFQFLRKFKNGIFTKYKFTGKFDNDTFNCNYYVKSELGEYLFVSKRKYLRCK